MRIWHSLDEVPSEHDARVVTIGNFDGVHRGHQHVIERARAVAAERRPCQVTVVTFDPHPIAVLHPDEAPATLTTVATRTELLGAAGVDDVLVLPFTREVAGWSPHRFVDDVLVGALHATTVVVGADFRFGRSAAGDVALLEQISQSRGFEVCAVALDGDAHVWSSTYIRKCLANGNVAGAAEALGRPFGVRGVVAEGDRRGRELGFPTANVAIATGAATPQDGVYAGRLQQLPDGELLPAAISVGTNPTFAGERARRVEAYVLGRDDLEIYGEEVEVSFMERLREMAKFDSVDELVATMRDDAARAADVLGVARPA